MITQEDFLMIRDIAKEVEMTQGRINISEIARRTGYDRKTVLKYVTALTPPQSHKRKKSASIVDPYKDYIRLRIEEYSRISAQRLHREIQTQGFTGSYSSVKQYVRSIRPEIPKPPIYRYESKPGKQVQVDWGSCGYVEIDGKRRQLYCFAMILGFSRMRYVEFTLRVDVPTFIQCHINAFCYFGGVSEHALYDNMKQVVIKRAFKGPDSEWHKQFDDFSLFYGFKHYLCRIRRPQTKGKVENLVGYVKRDFFYGSHFTSFQDLNRQAHRWMERVNNTTHGTTNEIPYERLSKENLKPIDAIPEYHIVRKENRKISRDCYFSYLGNRYSVPHKYSGRNTKLQIDEQCIRVYVQGKFICEHEIHNGSHQTIREKEHFKGLLALVQSEPTPGASQPGTVLRFAGPDVETRDLSSYEVSDHE